MRARVAAVLALALVLAVVAVVQHHRRSSPTPVAAPPKTVSSITPPWPQQAGVCNTPVEAPIVTSDALSDPVDAAVTVGGSKPGLLDVTSGTVTLLPGSTLTAQQYASQVVYSRSAAYSLIRSCQRRAVGTVVANQFGQAQRPVAVGRTFYGLLSDGRGGVWGEMYSGPALVRPESAVGTSLLRLDRPGRPIVVPPNLIPIGLFGTTLIASTAPTPVRSSLYRFDLSTGRLSALGPSYGASVSRGVLIWNSAPCSDVDVCPVHRYDLSTGQTSVRNYHLPLETSFADAVLSPDRTKVAFALEREISDGSYRSRSLGMPADLAVLNMKTGVIDPVSNLELAPDTVPTILTFSQGGSWLVVGFATATGTDVYAWRSGLSRPVKSPTP